MPAGVAFVGGSILDGGHLLRAFHDHQVTGVIHVAGFKYAGVSVQRPLHTYEQNVDGTTVLLAAMQEAGVDRIVFSSSAAVYGTPDVDLVTEDTAKAPESPYGESKLIGEWLLRDQAGRRGPAAHQPALLQRGRIRLSGCVRHQPAQPLPAGVRRARRGAHPDRSTATTIRPPMARTCATTCTSRDIAAAHVAAARRLDAGEPLEPAYNLGSGDGLSVRQIMDAMARVTGIAFDPEIGPAQAGRSAADRGRRAARRARSGLEDAALARRDGGQRVGRANRIRGDRRGMTRRKAERNIIRDLTRG